MAVFHSTVRTVCAAYFVLSLGITYIVLQAMWDSFVNGMVEVEALSGCGAGLEALKSTAPSILSTSTPSDKTIVCSAVSEDETFPVLIASSGVFTTMLQNGNSLWLCNHEGAMCFTFICDLDFNRFLED